MRVVTQSTENIKLFSNALRGILGFPFLEVVIQMTKLPVLDVVCIGFMLAVVLAAAGFWALVYGWIWLIVAVIVIVSMLVILLTSIKRTN